MLFQFSPMTVWFWLNVLIRWCWSSRCGISEFFCWMDFAVFLFFSWVKFQIFEFQLFLLFWIFNVFQLEIQLNVENWKCFRCVSTLIVWLYCSGAYATRTIIQLNSYFPDFNISIDGSTSRSSGWYPTLENRGMTGNREIGVICISHSASLNIRFVLLHDWYKIRCSRTILFKTIHSVKIHVHYSFSTVSVHFDFIWYIQLNFNKSKTKRFKEYEIWYSQ